MKSVEEMEEYNRIPSQKRKSPGRYTRSRSQWAEWKKSAHIANAIRRELTSKYGKELFSMWEKSHKSPARAFLQSVDNELRVLKKEIPEAKTMIPKWISVVE
ncbi:MAG: hypothetical protein V1776_03955 [Candidatus Diapherotrites archaeon]